MKRPGTAATPPNRPFYRQHFVTKLGEQKREAAGKYSLTTSVPKLTYTQAMRSWFLFQGQPYNVALCPPATFSAWIASLTPARWTPERRAEYIVLVDAPEDERLLSRWYTLEALIAQNVPKLLLYGSRQEADATKGENRQDASDGVYRTTKNL